jgi:H+/Cl- antiporter ClcA
MPFRWNLREHLTLVLYALRWTLIAAPVSAVIGSACALFLWSLDLATQTRWQHPWLLYLLPVGGVLIVLVYQYFGEKTEGGNNLIMDEIHEPGGGIPTRMAPLILISTVATHLFGGSAGREGTAVQMGGSIAATVGRWIKLDRSSVRKLLMVGVAAGFGGVFGTPLAAAVFAMEVIAAGRITYEAIFPCLIAGIVGDWSCTVWGIHHTRYMMSVGPVPFEWLTAAKVAAAAVVFGLTSVLFAELTHGLHQVWRKIIPIPWLRPAVGGALVILLTFLLGTRDYLGLGVTTPDPNGISIVSSFHLGGATPLSWWWKILFTAVTLSCGFKGGEVTPLFFIGSTLGNSLARLLHAPIDLFAGLGFVAVFSGATNTPLACTLMGIELFGSGHVTYLAIACFMAYLFSGHTSVYTSQRVATPKGSASNLDFSTPLKRIRDHLSRH